MQLTIAKTAWNVVDEISSTTGRIHPPPTLWHYGKCSSNRTKDENLTSCRWHFIDNISTSFGHCQLACRWLLNSISYGSTKMTYVSTRIIIGLVWSDSAWFGVYVQQVILMLLFLSFQADIKCLYFILTVIYLSVRLKKGWNMQPSWTRLIV
jgi:hypothetical protein